MSVLKPDHQLRDTINRIYQYLSQDQASVTLTLLSLILGLNIALNILFMLVLNPLDDVF